MSSHLHYPHPLIRVTIQTPPYKIPQLRRYHDLLRIINIPSLYQYLQLSLRPTSKRNMPIYHLVQRNPQRPHLRLLVINIRAQTLPRHIYRRPHIITLPLNIIPFLTKPKISYLQLSTRSYKNIRRFYIPMNVPTIV